MHNAGSHLDIASPHSTAAAIAERFVRSYRVRMFEPNDLLRRPAVMARRSISTAEGIQLFCSRNCKKARADTLRQQSGSRKLARAILVLRLR